MKQLHPVEWDCFVKDTKVLAEETAAFNGSAFDKDEKDTVKSKIDDLPFYCIGFKSAAPEYTLRTRIWASLRSQTLYRTVSGFMNYPRAIKLLYRVENPEVVQMFGGNSDKLGIRNSRQKNEKIQNSSFVPIPIFKLPTSMKSLLHAKARKLVFSRL